MTLGFTWAVRSDVGTVRTNNEDSAYASDRLLILADGMGGHAGGEVASVVAANRFAQVDPDADLPAQITRAGRETRTALHSMSLADPTLETMGTTMVCVASDGQDLIAGHIGDSRIYLLRGNELFQVTTDHTHVQYLVQSGQLRPEQVASHPYRAMLLRSLDDQPDGTDLDLISVEAAPGDRFLLCSDGLSDYVPAPIIGRLLAVGTSEESAEALIEAGLAAETRDNVTVVVADVIDADIEDDAAAMGGAAADPMTLSEDAAAALAGVMPGLVEGVPSLAGATGHDASVRGGTPYAAPAAGKAPATIPARASSEIASFPEQAGLGEPAEPTDPAELDRTDELPEPVEQPEPGEVDDPGEQPEPGEVDDPGEVAEPGEPRESTGTIEPGGPAEPAEPGEPPESADPSGAASGTPRSGIPIAGMLAAVAVLIIGVAIALLI